MLKKTNTSILCPGCHHPDTIVSVKELGQDFSDFVVDAFCTSPGCTWAARNGRTGAKAHNMLNGGPFDRGKTLFIPQKARYTLYDIGVEYGCRDDSHHVAFAGILEYAEPQKRVPEILLPVFNTWNYVPGSIRITEKSITFPVRKTALTGLIANTYVNDLLFITEKPVDALNLHLAAVDCFSSASAVLIPLKEKAPPLAPLVSASKIFSFVTDPEIKAYLKKALPEDAVFIEEGLHYERGMLALHLRDIVCG